MDAHIKINDALPVLAKKQDYPFRRQGAYIVTRVSIFGQTNGKRINTLNCAEQAFETVQYTEMKLSTHQSSAAFKVKRMDDLKRMLFSSLPGSVRELRNISRTFPTSCTCSTELKAENNNNNKLRWLKRLVRSEHCLREAQH